jgi:kinesin family member 21
MSKSLPGMPEENQERSSQEDGSDSESDTESDDKAIELQAEINDIQSDIEIKTKLIEQLELSQQRMMVMKQHYEDKLNVLSAKITNTQKERDQVLANMGRKLTHFIFSSDFNFSFSICRDSHCRSIVKDEESQRRV